MEAIVKTVLSELGYDPSVIDTNQEKRVNEWLKWFGGKTKHHNYFI